MWPVCTIFGLGAASAGIDLFREGKTLSGVMAVLLLAALFTPVVRTFAHYRRSAGARRIAGDAARHAGGKPDLRSLQTTLSSRQSAPKLRALVSGGYLQTCKSTRMSGTVKLYTPEYEYAVGLFGLRREEPRTKGRRDALQILRSAAREVSEPNGLPQRPNTSLRGNSLDYNMCNMKEGCMYEYSQLQLPLLRRAADLQRAKAAKLECVSCGNSFEPEALEMLNTAESGEQIVFERPKEGFQAGEEGVQIYHCKNCGAELMTEDTTTAAECPYCGSPTILPDRLEGGVKPEKGDSVRRDEGTGAKAV